MIDTLEGLRAAVRAGQGFRYVFFWSHRASGDGRLTAACLSQWWPCAFTLDGVAPRTIGGRRCDRAVVRVLNDDPCYAPAGHTVVQVMLPATYSWWATRGSSYNAEKDLVAQAALELLWLPVPAPEVAP